MTGRQRRRSGPGAVPLTEKRALYIRLTNHVSSSSTAVCDDLWGSMPMVITPCLLKPSGRWRTAAGNLSSGERLTPLLSHAGGDRWPAGTL